MYAILTRMMVQRSRTICAVTLVLGLVSATGCVRAGGGTVSITLDGMPVEVELADDPAERSRGLQEHEPLVGGQGMLFVFDQAAPRTCAMKDVAFAIDVVFVDEQDRVSAVERLVPGDTHPVTGPAPARYVIELPAGWAAEHGIGVGSRFQPPE